MIKPDDSCVIDMLPISELSVTEAQDRYPDKIAHYIELLKNDRVNHPGFIIVRPYKDRYEILDGHHRYIAHIACGRRIALCIVVKEAE